MIILPSRRNFNRSVRAACVVADLAIAGGAIAHGDVTPQAVDTHTLPQLGEEWRAENPYRSEPTRTEAVRIGTSGYNQNCARCHGLEAVSGGIAPDLRKIEVRAILGRNAKAAPPDAPRPPARSRHVDVGAGQDADGRAMAVTGFAAPQHPERAPDARVAELPPSARS